MKTKNLTAFYGFIQAAYWMGFAAISGYVSLYLLDLGFTSSTIGVLIAAAGIVSAAAQPMVAAYADRPDSISLRALNLIVAGLTALCGVLVLLTRSSRVLTLLSFGGALALLQLSTPLINALGMNSINCGSRLNYGAAKSTSSVSYALASFLLGRLAARWGGVVVPAAILVFYALFLLSLFLYPTERTPRADTQVQTGSMIAFFRKYPRYAMVLLGCIGLFVSHILLNSFTLQIIQTKGGGSEQMGTAMAIAALSEMPTLLCFSILLKRAGSHVWMRVTGFFFVLKNLGSLLCAGVGAFYAVQLLQLLAWALICVSSVYYVNSIMEPEDAVKGQAYYTMAYTLGTVVGSIIGGRIIDAMGVAQMLVFGTVSAAAGTLIILLFTQKTEDRV